MAANIQVTLRSPNNEVYTGYLVGETMTIGRSSSANIPINNGDGQISGHHLLLHWNGASMFARDVSTNGTMLNGRRLNQTPTEVRQGDQLVLGRSNFVVSWAISGGSYTEGTVYAPQPQQSYRREASHYCPHCGQAMNASQGTCPRCGYAAGKQQHHHETPAPYTPPQEHHSSGGGSYYAPPPPQRRRGDLNGKSKDTMALVCLFLGGLGIHNFIMGETKKGLFRLLLFFFGCGLGGLFALIDFIKILADSYTWDPDALI